MTDLSHPRIGRVLGLAVLLTSVSELVYLVVWGVWLFPAGDLAGKMVWAPTCVIAMGSVIGAGVLLWAEPMRRGAAAVWRTAAVVTAVGSFCAWLCSRIEARFGYFGGAENGTLFVVAGVVPALFGGFLNGWLLYGRRAALPHG